MGRLFCWGVSWHVNKYKCLLGIFGLLLILGVFDGCAANDRRPSPVSESGIYNRSSRCGVVVANGLGDGYVIRNIAVDGVCRGFELEPNTMTPPLSDHYWHDRPYTLNISVDVFSVETGELVGTTTRNFLVESSYRANQRDYKMQAWVVDRFDPVKG